MNDTDKRIQALQAAAQQIGEATATAVVAGCIVTVHSVDLQSSKMLLEHELKEGRSRSRKVKPAFAWN